MFLRFCLFCCCCPHSFAFGTSLFIKRPTFHYILTLITFKHINFGKHIWIHTSKLIKNMLILKFHPRMRCLHVFFSFFHPGMKSHPCLSSQDEIWSRLKCVNSKIHLTIDRDDFILGRVSSQDEISRVNTL